MLNFLERIAFGFWDVIRRLVGLIVPFVSQARDFRGIGRWLRWTLAFLVLAGILLGLWWVNEKFEVYLYIQHAPSPFGINLARFFLPIIALLIYLMIWIGWWVWKLLRPEAEIAEFPDIEQSWEEAVRALNQAGIDLRDAPLFLILGRPAGSEAALFEGAQLDLKVSYAPGKPTAPLHVYANKEGIYVTCAGASLLGRQAAILAGEVDPTMDGAAEGAGFGTRGEDPFKTLQPRGALKQVQSVLARAREQGRTPDKLTEQEKQEIHELIQQEQQEHAQKAAKARPLLLRDTQEVAHLTARLKYLCRLIVQDRQPYCPVNGVLLLVPFAATESKEMADQTGLICQHDLAAARSTLQVHCPLFAMVCDLEAADGFREFIDRFPIEQRQRRVGQRFPLCPDLGEGELLKDYIESSVQWICNASFPSWIYKLFRVEAAGRDELATVIRGNSRLYNLLCLVRDRRKRLSDLVLRMLATEQAQPWLYGGCYLAGTGREIALEQAFVPGVFRRLTENQNFVSWTDEAFLEEENSNRLVSYARIGIGLGGAAAVGMLYLLIWGKSS